MFELLRRFVQSQEAREIEAKYRMLRLADFWYYLGWVLYYEQAFVDLREKWERQAYEPKSMYDVVRNYLRRK